MGPIKEFLSLARGSALAVYRYWTARQEIEKMKGVDTQLREEHLINAMMLPSRDELLKRAPKGGVAAEIGVADGKFSRKILDTIAPEKLYLIDYWKDGKRSHGQAPALKGAAVSDQAQSDWARINQRMQSEITAGQVELRRGFSWDEIPKLDDGCLDWAYIDAGHDYDSVRKDLEAIRPKMKPNGIICGHDYVKWSRFGFRCGVVEAVNAFCLNQGYELFQVTMDARTTSSFAIRPLS